jgi:hypothetical protein
VDLVDTARSNRTCGQNMPGSLGHEALDAATFAEYGADWLKNDDCHVVYARAEEDYGAMEAAIAAQGRPMLHNVKAPDLTPAQAQSVSQFRRVAKDLKNTWQDMVRVLDSGYDPAYLSLVGPTNNFFSDFDMLEVRRWLQGPTPRSPAHTLTPFVAGRGTPSPPPTATAYLPRGRWATTPTLAAPVWCTPDSQSSLWEVR